VANVPIYDGRGLAIGCIDTMQCGVVHDLYWSVVGSIIHKAPGSYRPAARAHT
jgi:hypothetical protein